jgi:hypothetical protein
MRDVVALLVDAGRERWVRDVVVLLVDAERERWARVSVA